MDNKKKKKIISLVVMAIIVIFVVISVILLKKNELERQQNVENQSQEENVSVEDLMQDVNATADSNIYDVATEYDGRKVLSVKTSVQFSVAFAGKIKEDLTSIEEAKTITEQQLPTNTGIYLGNQDNKVLEYINNYTNCTYGVSEEGYLELKEQNENNDYDNRIQKIMQSDNLYIVYCDGEMRIVDNITGEIGNYDFENIDPYQAYEYCKDENKMFVELTTNKKAELSDDEIFTALIELLEYDIEN